MANCTKEFRMVDFLTTEIGKYVFEHGKNTPINQCSIVRDEKCSQVIEKIMLQGLLPITVNISTNCILSDKNELSIAKKFMNCEFALTGTIDESYENGDYSIPELKAKFDDLLVYVNYVELAPGKSEDSACVILNTNAVNFNAGEKRNAKYHNNEGWILSQELAKHLTYSLGHTDSRWNVSNLVARVCAFQNEKFFDLEMSTNKLVEEFFEENFSSMFKRRISKKFLDLFEVIKNSLFFETLKEGKHTFVNIDRLFYTMVCLSEFPLKKVSEKEDEISKVLENYFSTIEFGKEKSNHGYKIVSKHVTALTTELRKVVK